MRPLPLGTSGANILILLAIDPHPKEARRLRWSQATRAAGGTPKSREETPKEGNDSATRYRTPYANRNAADSFELSAAFYLICFGHIAGW